MGIVTTLWHVIRDDFKNWYNMHHFVVTSKIDFSNLQQLLVLFNETVKYIRASPFFETQGKWESVLFGLLTTGCYHRNSVQLNAVVLIMRLDLKGLETVAPHSDEYDPCTFWNVTLSLHLFDLSMPNAVELSIVITISVSPVVVCVKMFDGYVQSYDVVMTAPPNSGTTSGMGTGKDFMMEFTPVVYFLATSLSSDGKLYFIRFEA